jgi:biotin transport system substrate-specific component
MRTQSIPVAFYSIENREHALLLKVAMAFGFAVATAIGAQIQIPLGFTPVPITLQTLFVFSSGLFLGGYFGLLSQVIYLLMGLAGLPVFSGASSGSSAVLGATGGYLVGFLLFSYFSGRLFYGRKNRGFTIQALQLYLLSVACVFVPGVTVLKLATGVTWAQAVMMGYIPFVLGDVVKILIGLGAAAGLQKSQSCQTQS